MESRSNVSGSHSSCYDNQHRAEGGGLRMCILCGLSVSPNAPSPSAAGQQMGGATLSSLLAQHHRVSCVTRYRVISFISRRLSGQESVSTLDTKIS